MKTSLDRYNLNILKILQRDGRISNQALADRVGLSPSACLERVRKLEKQGLIRTYRAELGLERYCATVSVYATVTLHDHRKQEFDQFERAVREIPELVECAKVSGQFDYILKFICPDMARYHHLSDALLAAGTGMLEVNSHVVLDTTKPFTGVPVDAIVAREP